MRILVDENIPLMTVKRLREFGHDVQDVRGTPDQGLEDPDLWSAALTGGGVLITTDQGFTEFCTTITTGSQSASKQWWRRLLVCCAGTRAGVCSTREEEGRDESRPGRQECLRHGLASSL
jgi:hypothetical protein